MNYSDEHAKIVMSNKIPIFLQTFQNILQRMDNFQNTASDLKEVQQGDKLKKPDQGSLYQTPIQELGIRIKPGDKQDIDQINMILSQILSYPSTQIAQIHRYANRLGNRDLQKEQKASKNVLEDELHRAQFCPCCGFVKQEDEIKLCTKISDISNIGISTFLYFQALKNSAILLSELFIIYSIYSLITNVMASNAFTTCSGLVNCSSNVDYLTISLGSKEQNQTTQNQNYYYIQAWIGVALVIIWAVSFFLVKYFEEKEEQQVDTQTTSASDFSIVIQNVPLGLTEKDLQDQLDNYNQTINGLSHIPNIMKVPFKIRKYNQGKPFFLNEDELNDDQLNDIQKEHSQMIQMFTKWILEREDSQSFSTTKEERQSQYTKFGQLTKRRASKLQDLVTKIRSKFHVGNQQGEVYTTVFVTFDTNKAKDSILYFNPIDYASRIRNFITCGQINHFLTLTYKQHHLPIQIHRAPQPEDIIWSNIGMTDCKKLLRKIVTYSVTAILLCISFIIVYGLSLAQSNNKNNRYLSILISITISLINIIMSQAIRRLTLFERDYTQTTHQTSLAIKAVVAQLINSILVPIIANYYIKSNLYEQDGLADDIFMLGLTNAFIAPALKYFDGYYLFTRILAWYYSKPNSKLSLNQKDLNDIVINIEFEVGYEYIYIVNLFLFVCFFVSLQPILPLFALTGYLFMYWTQKYSLFNRTRRPVPGTDLVHDAMSQILFLGPVVYSLGSLTWSNFLPGGIPQSALLPNLIALGISIFIMIFPVNLIFDWCQSDAIPQPPLTYDENRIFFSTEYDRLNPTTSQEGYKEYMAFVDKYNEELNKKDETEKKKVAKKLQANSKKGNQRTMQPPMVHSMVASLFQPPPPSNQAALVNHLFPSIMNQNRPPVNQPSFIPAQQINQPVPLQTGFMPIPQIQQNNQFQQPQRSGFQPVGFGYQPQQQGFGYGFQPQQQGFGYGFQPQQQGFGFNNQASNFQFGGFQQQGFNPYNNNFRF